ncbi:GntR family transcriptional regulator [Dactylosporangium sp. AC04546]|uniref:GntR family transcriptional regulator n=1 Tax=Dactylosporangium sp. AC04546 TaxID=2862460 RepID=UPI001EE0D752|nr:GntR family transcriptional regulator [Dactylosporangium sp. AC04546]WVK79371.1 GntR family transcriptional regulator [Dactylosporangium sp. AC04546]
MTDDMTDGPAESAASLRVAAYLRQAILDGQIPPGQRIRQNEVAERLGASRLPVREALRMLTAEGLTEQEPNKGARVLRLGARELDVVYRMRERLEPLALAESLPRLDDAVIAELEALQRAIERNTDVTEFLRLDREFHLLTYSRCEVEPLAGIVVRLWNSTQYYRRAFMTIIGETRRWIVNAEHQLLLDAVRRGDVVDAGRVLEGHIRRTRVELSHHPEIFTANG